MDYRNILVAITIAALFTIFTQTTVDAFIQQPDYQDFCSIEPRSELQPEVFRECNEQYQQARESQALIIFLGSSILGLAAVIITLLLKTKHPVSLAISTGFLLGGLVSIFIGTIRGWESILEPIRPFVMLAEIALVIIVAYRKLQK